jgi:hypothetical protein
VPTAVPTAVSQAHDRRRALWSALVVAIVAWSAHFLFFRRFGLYEDDCFFVGRQLAWTWRDVLASLQYTARTFYQGRPLGFLLVNVVPFACFQLGGVRALPLVYLAASTTIVANALLAHRLLSVAYGPSFALLGALAFTLYPAHTSQTYLTHALVLQPALTLVLLALLAYLHERRVLAYVLAACCLLTYESGVLAFFAAPLVGPTWDRGIIRRWARHLGVVLGIVVAVLALRAAVGEFRAIHLAQAAGVGWSQVPGRALQAMWIGPRVSLAAFVTRPGWAMRDVVEGAVGLVATTAFAVVFAILTFGPRFAAGMAARPVLLRAGITGLVMLVGGYALEFPEGHFPPIFEAGRFSAVHLGATLGAAILVASLLSLAWTVARRRAARVALGGLLALYLASLFAFRLVVQRGFVSAAEQQREYWSRIVALVPDLSADTVVILMGSETPRNAFILASSWSDNWVLHSLFHDASGRSPDIVGAPRGFDESLLQVRDGRLRWSWAVPRWMGIDTRPPLTAGNVVVLERRRFKWKRRNGSITLQGIDIDLPPAPPGAAIRLMPGPLHDLLLPPAAPAPTP